MKFNKFKNILVFYIKNLLLSMLWMVIGLVPYTYQTRYAQSVANAIVQKQVTAADNVLIQNDMMMFSTLSAIFIAYAAYRIFIKMNWRYTKNETHKEKPNTSTKN